MKTKKLLLLIGGLLLMFGLSGCSLIKGTRANIEKQLEGIGMVYPTKHIEDLFDKFPRGFRLVNIRHIEENTYSIVLETDETRKITGTFSVSQEYGEPESFKNLFEGEIRVENGEIVPIVPLSSEYEQYLKQFKFLFQELDLSKTSIKEFKYQKHRVNANDDYSISYLIEHQQLSEILKSESKTINLLLGGAFDSDKKGEFRKSVDIWFTDYNNNIHESVTSTGRKK